MILIGRGLDLGEKGTGESEQGTGEARADLGAGNGNRNPWKKVCERKKNERKNGGCLGRTAEGKPTCAVLRVRSLELRAKAREGSQEADVMPNWREREGGSESDGTCNVPRGSERREPCSFPVTIA